MGPLFSLALNQSTLCLSDEDQYVEQFLRLAKKKPVDVGGLRVSTEMREV